LINSFDGYTRIFALFHRLSKSFNHDTDHVAMAGEQPMKTLLVVKASILGAQGASTGLANDFVQSWQSKHPTGRVVTRDVGLEPIPHLDAARLGAFMTPVARRTPEQQAVVALSDALIDELRRADEILLTAPMYNFGLPSGLKAWIDHLARAGVTFRYTENGSVGLLPNRKVYVLATRGGLYAGTAKDTVTPYLTDFLTFIGLSDVEFIYAEGLNVSAEQKARALNEARAHIHLIAAERALAEVA
jgi:FMN-dependent NADH-azoreductase